MNNYRDKSCDYMRGFLVIIMILSHIKAVTTGEDYFCLYVNLSAFSGFLFCSGFAYNLAYFGQKKVKPHSLIRNFVKVMFIYYASAFFHIAISEENLSIENIKQIFFLERLAGFSEFLVSFAYLYLVVLVLFPVIRRVVSRASWMIIAIIISLLSTFLPYDYITNPWIGPLIGGEPSNFFPLLQYASYFILGGYVSYIQTLSVKNNLNEEELKIKKFDDKFKYILPIICAAGTICFAIKVHILKELPDRFGPDIIWIIGGYLPVYLYYVGARWFTKIESLGRSRTQTEDGQKEPLNKRIITMTKTALDFAGKHSLRFLLVSNIFVFAADSIGISLLIDNHQLRFGIYAIITFATCIISAWEISTENI